MSGGSYDYLYDKELSTIPVELENMARSLDELGYASEAASATYAIIRHLRQADAMASELRAVWKAVEWFHSNDTGIEPVKAALFDYERSA